MRKAFFSTLISFILCAAFAVQVPAKEFILMASTIDPIDAGIVAALEDLFEKDSGIRVRHVGVKPVRH